jgi:O-antigen ligase
VFATIPKHKRLVKYVNIAFCLAIFASVALLLSSITTILRYECFYCAMESSLPMHRPYYSLLLIISMILMVKYFRTVGRLLKFVFSISALCSAFVLISIFPKTLFLSLLVVGLVYVFSKLFDLSRHAYAVAVVALICAGLAVQMLGTDNVTNALQQSDWRVEASLNNRAVISQATQRLLSDPTTAIFGVGIGQVTAALQRQYCVIAPTYCQTEFNAHNQYFESWLAVGILGFLLLLGLIYYLVYTFTVRGQLAYAIVFMLFALCMLTESFLNREAGVLTLMFFSSLWISEPNDK